ncbi:bZIP-like protein [Gossypium australe]|uniref:BZIP-like protein n=1 Tax=Gossypium australe TaxID=47621 RepID=A0A5B6WQ15_9ROSI|nr:bZIP-like protein [Gossypium australe]
MIHDNVLIMHELLHYLQSSKNDPNKVFAIEMVMKKMCFDNKWTDKIMDCVWSVRRKKMAFQEITNRLSCRINNWTKRLLSFGGKEVFIKVVLQAIPTYALSIS